MPETRIDSHTIRVVHEDAPEAEHPNGYLYEFGIKYGDEDWMPCAIPLSKRRWAGNFWREIEETPEEIPDCVRRTVLSKTGVTVADFEEVGA